MTWSLEEPRRDTVENPPRPPCWRTWTPASFSITSATFSIRPWNWERSMTVKKPGVISMSTLPVSIFSEVTSTSSMTVSCSWEPEEDFSLAESS